MHTNIVLFHIRKHKSKKYSYTEQNSYSILLFVSIFGSLLPSLFSHFYFSFPLALLLFWKIALPFNLFCVDSPDAYITNAMREKENFVWCGEHASKLIVVLFCKCNQLVSLFPTHSVWFFLGYLVFTYNFHTLYLTVFTTPFYSLFLLLSISLSPLPSLLPFSARVLFTSKYLNILYSIWTKVTQTTEKKTTHNTHNDKQAQQEKKKHCSRKKHDLKKTRIKTYRNEFGTFTPILCCLPWFRLPTFLPSCSPNFSFSLSFSWNFFSIEYILQ